MKLSIFTSRLRRLLALLALCVASTVQAEPTMLVNYDQTSDRLSVNAEAASLKSVLGKIAAQSGLEVLFDETADAPLSINIESSPLEKALEQILRGSSHVMRYDRDKQGQRLLIGVSVLPAGQEDDGRARPLLNQNNEAYHYASKRASADKTPAADAGAGGLNDERWQARLAEMPAELREQLELRTSKRLAMEKERQQQRQKLAKQKAEKKKETEAHRAKIQQRQQNMLNSLDPERRAQYEQGGEQAREHIRQQLQNNQP